MLPIFLSVFESIIPFIVPFCVKPRFVKVILCENIFLMAAALGFFITFEILNFDTCYYASDFLKVFVLLFIGLLGLLAILELRFYCKIRK